MQDEPDLEKLQERLEQRREEDRALRARDPSEVRSETQRALAELRRSVRERHRGPSEDQIALALRRCERDERQPERVRRALRTVGVPERILRRGWREELIPPEILRWGRRFPDALREGGSAYLWGPNGTGKTGAACWLMRQAYLSGHARWNEVLQRPDYVAPRMQLITAPELYRLIFNRDTAYVGRLAMMPLLVIDEYGAAYEHDWPRLEVRELVNRRWNDCRTTILTSNQSKDRFDDEHEAVASRIDDRAGPGMVAMVREDLRRRRA